MLKACWDCLAGETQRQGDNSYNIHVNGGSRGPQWQTSSRLHGIIFLVPTQLKESDEITIKGTMVDGMLDIKLRPDNDETQHNIVCQFNVVTPENDQPHNAIEIRTVKDGIIEDYGGGHRASDYFNETNYDIRFVIKSQGISLLANNSSIETIPLRHSHQDIRYISVKGEVNELNFTFS